MNIDNEKARLEGLRSGIRFRESELEYDVNMAYTCMICREKVWYWPTNIFTNLYRIAGCCSICTINAVNKRNK